MHGLGILEYNNELSLLLESKTEIAENSMYEVEIRASMIIVINYIYEQVNKSIVSKISLSVFIFLI